MSQLTSAKFQILAMIGLTVFVLATFSGVYLSLRQYQVNPWLFLVINVATIPPYTYGIGHMISGIISRRFTRALLWALVATAAFMAPYAYIALAGRQIPLQLAGGMVVIVIFLALLAILRAWRQFRATKQQSVPRV